MEPTDPDSAPRALRLATPARSGGRARRGASILTALLLATFASGQTNAPPAPDPKQLYEEVKTAIAAGRFEAALPLINRIIALDPSYAEAYRAGAYANCELGRFREAAEALAAFRKLVPRDRHNILILLGRIQIGLEQYREAADTFERVVLLKPTAPGIYTSLGKLYGRLENLPLAIERLETALKRDPPAFRAEALDLLKWAHSRQIEACMRESRLEEAVAHLDRLLAIDPPAAADFLRRGALLSELGSDLRQAEEDIIAYITTHAGAARAHLLLGRVRQQMGKMAQAIESYEDALALDPAIPGLDALLGILHYQANAFPKALASLQRAVALNPRDLTSQYNLGLAHFRLEQVDQAAAIMKSVAESKPEAAAPHLILAAIALQAGDVERALLCLEDWSTRVRKGDDIQRLEKERLFETLYHNTQYRALLNDLKARVSPEQAATSAVPPRAAERGE